MRHKKNLTKRKNKQRGGKTKKKVKKIMPEEISKILSNLHILLSFPSIEFLPSSTIFNKNNTGHYLQMIDYQDLATIINQNPTYKKSPTIQKIFNYQSYQIEHESEITFNYQNIRCDNLIMKEQKNYNVKLFFLYLLECNVSERLKYIIQLGGDNEYNIENMLDYDIKKENFEQFSKKEKDNELEKELENVREIERAKFKERRILEEEERRIKEHEEKMNALNSKKEFEDEIKVQQDKVDHTRPVYDKTSNGLENEIDEEKDKLEEIQYDQKEFISKMPENISEEVKEIDEEIDEKISFEKELANDEMKVREKLMKDRMEMEKRIEIKVKGFEESLENKKVSNISKNSFAVFNVNWFNVCCGLEKYDEEFEEEVNKHIQEMGIIIDKDEIRDTLLKLFEDKDELFNFRMMIKSRLLTCSEVNKPSFFDKLFTDSFGSFKKCDERSPQSILYLYDEYRVFLERVLDLTKLERVLILIYCETRQHILSRYISLEILRKNNGKKRKEKIRSILDKIMISDKSIIKENDKILKEKMKLQFGDYKQKRIQELNEQNRVKALLHENNIVVQKNKVKNLMDEKHINDEINDEHELVKKNNDAGWFDNLKELFEKNIEEPSFELRLTPKEREAYKKAMKKMIGGGINYELTSTSKNEVCKKIKDEKNIYNGQLDIINDCFI